MSTTKTVSVVVALFAVISVIGVGVWYAITPSRTLTEVPSSSIKKGSVLKTPESPESTLKDLFPDDPVKSESKGMEASASKDVKAADVEPLSPPVSVAPVASKNDSQPAVVEPVAKKNPLLALRDLVMSSRRNMVITAVSTVLSLLILITCIVVLSLWNAKEDTDLIPEVPELDMTPRGIATRWFEEFNGKYGWRVYAIPVVIVALVTGLCGGMIYSVYHFGSNCFLIFIFAIGLPFSYVTVLLLIALAVPILWVVLAGTGMSTFLLCVQMLFGGKMVFAICLGLMSTIALLAFVSTVLIGFLLATKPSDPVEFLEKKLHKICRYGKKKTKLRVFVSIMVMVVIALLAFLSSRFYAILE